MGGEGLRKTYYPCRIQDECPVAQGVSEEIGDIIDRVAIKPLRIDRPPLPGRILNDVLVMKVTMQRSLALLRAEQPACGIRGPARQPLEI